jgi:hypothetical protein
MGWTRTSDVDDTEIIILPFTKPTPVQHNTYNINMFYLLRHVSVFVNHHQAMHTNIFNT